MLPRHLNRTWDSGQDFPAVVVLEKKSGLVFFLCSCQARSGEIQFLLSFISTLCGNRYDICNSCPLLDALPLAFEWRREKPKSCSLLCFYPSVHLGEQIYFERESKMLNFHIHLPGYWWMIIRKTTVRKKARLQWNEDAISKQVSVRCSPYCFSAPICCLEVSGLFNNTRTPVFSTQGILLTTCECYCLEGPSQNVPFFPVWNCLHRDLCTCFHAILNVWVVPLLCRAGKEGSWQALE